MSDFGENLSHIEAQAQNPDLISRAKRLTKRELAIAEALVESKIIKEIAFEQNLAYSTTVNYVKNIYQRLQISSKSQLKEIWPVVKIILSKLNNEPN